MKVIISDTYESMSRQAADDLVKIMRYSKKPLFCPASGDTPGGLYQRLVTLSREYAVDVSDWFFVGLDEWVGLNAEDEGSCRDYLNRQIFGPLHIKDEKICFYDGKAEDLQTECKKSDNFIRLHGGIKVCVLGLGLNGHIGMNEPGSSPELYSHIAEIDPVTKAVGQKYFKTPQNLSLGITLGISSIMESENVYLLVSGQKKAGIVKEVLEGGITNQVPASFLRQHPNISIYLDREAASMLSNI